MPYVIDGDGPGIDEGLLAFGEALRKARFRAKMSQMRLEERSGVDQTLISRLERGLAPHCSLRRLVWLQRALGRNLPFGSCPHDHDCQFREGPGTLKESRKFDLDAFIRRHRALQAELIDDEQSPVASA